MTRLTRASLAAALAAVALGAVAVTASAHRAAHPRLVGTVGKGNAFTITLRTSAGKLVKTIPAGTYTVVIHDDSALHNYELDGPHGKSWTFTSVPFTGTKTVTLKLAAGAYKAYCVAHESTMFQHFKAT